MSDWRDHTNVMTVAERIRAQASAGYDVTRPWAELARVCANAELERHRATQQVLAEEVEFRLGVEAERDVLKAGQAALAAQVGTLTADRDKIQAAFDRLWEGLEMRDLVSERDALAETAARLRAFLDQALTLAELAPWWVDETGSAVLTKAMVRRILDRESISPAEAAAAERLKGGAA